jgi:hypothetical protein
MPIEAGTELFHSFDQIDFPSKQIVDQIAERTPLIIGTRLQIREYFSQTLGQARRMCNARTDRVIVTVSCLPENGRAPYWSSALL